MRTATGLPHDLGDRITRDGVVTAWLTQLLPEKPGIAVEGAHQSIQATLADVVLGEELAVPHGTPLLQAERVYYAGKGRLLYVAHGWYPADRFRYVAVFGFRKHASRERKRA